MNSAVLVTFTCIAAGLLVLLCVLVGMVLVDRNRVRRELAGSRSEVEALRARLDGVARQVAQRAESDRLSAAAAAPVPQTEYVITTAGFSTVDADPVPNRAVLSATLGEPLVKVVAFGYGLRRALSPETRNRIGFEMRREVRRSRKQRRRNLKEARRAADAAQRAEDQEDAA